MISIGLLQIPTACQHEVRAMLESDFNSSELSSAWGEAELRDKLIWEELAETSHRAGSKTVIVFLAKTKEILPLNTLDKIRLSGKNLVHQIHTKAFS